MLTLRVCGSRRSPVPVERHPPRQAGDEPLLEQVAQPGQGRRRVRRQLRPGQVGGGAERHRERDVLGAGAQATLLAASFDQRTQGNPRRDVQGSDALGRVHLVAHHRQQVRAPRAGVDRHLAGGLGRVDVQQHPDERG